MTIVYSILLIIIGIVLFLLILALFIPKKYSVTVDTTISKPTNTVYDFLSILANQVYYSEWFLADEQLPFQITGTDGTPGAILSWDSNNKEMGAGEQEIKYMDNNKIDIELRFIRPIAGICKLSNNIIAVTPGQTHYTCTFSAYARYPINLPAYILGRRFIRKAQKKTLDNLKFLLED